MYHTTRQRKRQSEICARMRAVKELQRIQTAIELGPRSAIFTPPKLRRVVVVIDYDLGVKVDVFKMRRTNRIDSYSVEYNTKSVDGAIGWTNFCKRLSVHYPRLLSPSAQAE